MRHALGFERCTVIMVLAVTGIAMTVAPSHADPLQCQRTILKTSAAYAQARMKALAKCEHARLTGKVTTTCELDPKTNEAIAKADTKLRNALGKACGGGDKICGTGGDDDALAAIGWPGTCPDFAGAGCTNTIGHCGDVATCAVCIGDEAIGQSIALAYGAFNPSAPNGSLGKCQLAIGKATAAFFAAKTKALAKCWDARHNGKHANACPAPGDGKAAAAIAKTQAKASATIAKACAGQSPAAIGFASHCPAVTVPGGPACGGAIGDVASLSACLTCVTAFAVDCDTTLVVPGFSPYPAECVAAPPTPTPTVTATATPTATATATFTASQTPTPTPTPSVSTTPTSSTTGTATLTATATVTVTPTATVTQIATATLTPTPTPTTTPASLCGNNVINAGENCDDGNTNDCDACPSDCHTAPADCTAQAVRHNQQVQVNAPTELGAAVFCLKYPAGTVGLPGSGTVGGRISGFAGSNNVVDFNNAAQVALVPAGSQSQFSFTVSFDRCVGAPVPPVAQFNCVTKDASDTLGNTLSPPSIVQCMPVGP